MDRLKDKVCIITGSAVGQGRAAALLFAQEGARVMGCDIDDVGGQAVASQIKGKGGQAAYVHCDVSKADQVQDLVRATVRAFGRIDVLYNNAGFHHVMDDKVVDLGNEAWDGTLNVNLRGPFLCCKYAIPVMVKTGGGAVINTSSVGAVIGLEATSYGVSKAGLLALTKAVAKQYGAQGIRCNAILPSGVDTNFQINVRKTEERKGKAIRSGIGPMIARRATAEEVAAMALFLASDESRFITGADFLIDGGMTAR